MNLETCSDPHFRSSQPDCETELDLKDVVSAAQGSRAGRSHGGVHPDSATRSVGDFMLRLRLNNSLNPSTKTKTKQPSLRFWVYFECFQVYPSQGIPSPLEAVMNQITSEEKNPSTTGSSSLAHFRHPSPSTEEYLWARRPSAMLQVAYMGILTIPAVGSVHSLWRSSLTLLYGTPCQSPAFINTPVQSRLGDL